MQKTKFLYFLFKWKGVCLNQQVCLIKYVENEISSPTSHKKKKKKERERDEQKHNPNSKAFPKLLKNFH